MLAHQKSAEMTKGIQSRSLMFGNNPSQPVITTCHNNSTQADLDYHVDTYKHMTMR